MPGNRRISERFSDDYTIQGGKFVTYIGSKDTDAGKIEGQYLVSKLPEGGNVAYLVGGYGVASTERRKDGFESVIKDYPKLNIVTELQGFSSREKSQAIMQSLLQKYKKGELQALVAQNDEMAIGASSAIQAAGRLGEFKVLIGVDGSKPALDAVTAGTLTARSSNCSCQATIGCPSGTCFQTIRNSLLPNVPKGGAIVAPARV